MWWIYQGFSRFWHWRVWVKSTDCNPHNKSSCGQPWAHLGPVGPRWAPRWPHESCYKGSQFPCPTAPQLTTQPTDWLNDRLVPISWSPEETSFANNLLWNSCVFLKRKHHTTGFCITAVDWSQITSSAAVLTGEPRPGGCDQLISYEPKAYGSVLGRGVRSPNWDAVWPIRNSPFVLIPYFHYI